MNFDYKLIWSFAFCLLLVSACDQTELDLRVSPNDLAADASDPNLLLNAVQIAFAGNQGAVSDLSLIHI